MSIIKSAFFLLATAGQIVHAPQPTAKLLLSTPPFLQQNEIIPRLEWDKNFGYCGETSLISAGLYYGQYCSQYTARALASPGVPQSDSDSQLLLGVNDQTAADAMQLDTVEWDGSGKNTNDFLAWVKTYVTQGSPVIIGVFNNEFLLYGDSNPDAGDSDYDHIVVAYGIGSQHSLSDTSFYPDDTLYLIDNGLWAAFRNPPYYFSYSFAASEMNRQQANSPNGPIYSLNKDENYGMVVTGVKDDDGDTIPVRLTTSVNYEIPEILLNDPPPPISLTLTISVSIPDTSVGYYLYWYNNFANVPSSHFNGNAANAYQRFTIPPNSGTTYTQTVEILSNEVAAFRAVPITAP